MSQEFKDAVALVTRKQQKFPITVHIRKQKPTYAQLISSYKVVKMDLKTKQKQKMRSENMQRRSDEALQHVRMSGFVNNSQTQDL